MLCTQVHFFLASAMTASVLVSHTSTALATSCQVYPLEYAYKDDSVTGAESVYANCRDYLPGGEIQEMYTRCRSGGIPLKLTDSNFGQEQYQSTDYYVWSTGSEQLLFIFPTRVSLTTITLHYYSDSDRGLPRLIFYAVPDDFDIWDLPTTDIPHVNVAEIQPVREPAGRRSVNITVNFNKKLLMFKYSSTTIILAVSEVQFFNCSSPTTTVTVSNTTDSISTDPGATVIETTNQTSNSTLTTTTVSENNGSLYQLDSSAPTATTHNNYSVVQNVIANGAPGVTILIGIGVAILIVLAAIVVVVTLVLLYLRKSSHPKAKSDYDNSYSTLRRGDAQQPQPHSQQPPTDLYDQIQLSPSTGQAEIVSKAEIENTNILSSHQTSVSTNTDTDHSNKISGQDNVATFEQPTYAAVDKKQKKKKKGQEVVLSGNKGDTKNKIKQREATPTSLHTTESPEALYSVVKKKPKADKEETVPPPPPHSLEELYTAVKKNVKGSAMEEEEGAPQIPPHTIEELYTAVVKKPKGDSTDRETDGAPPIVPPHTVDDC